MSAQPLPIGASGTDADAANLLKNTENRLVREQKTVGMKKSPDVVKTIPGVVKIILGLVDKYLQVFNLLLGKYSICSLSSIQCVACQVFID